MAEVTPLSPLGPPSAAALAAAILVHALRTCAQSVPRVQKPSRICCALSWAAWKCLARPRLLACQEGDRGDQREGQAGEGQIDAIAAVLPGIQLPH